MPRHRAKVFRITLGRPRQQPIFSTQPLHPTSNTYHLLVTTTTERHHAFHLNPIDIPTFRILGFRFFFPSQFRLTLINTSSSRIQPPARAAELRYRPLPDVESAVLYGGYAYQQQQCVYIAFGLEYRREY
jgi:hypothetical protein